MAEEQQLRKVPQYQESPLVTVTKLALAYRFAYARAAETREANDIGQDYLTIHESDTWLAFALCDGVSQSFFGNLAAQQLGDALIKWLSDVITLPYTAGEITNSLSDHLQCLTEPATEIIKKQPLPSDIPEMFREVLEDKRAKGSQSTFACGRIDLPSATFPGGHILLAWMGDSRLKVWREGSDVPLDLGGVFDTNQRWSTNRGLLNGSPNVYLSALETEGLSISRIMSYSDGLAALDSWNEEPSNAIVQEMIDHAGQASTSDDISFIEIWLGAAPADREATMLPAPSFLDVGYRDGDIRASWKTVPKAIAYQIECNGDVYEKQTGRNWEYPVVIPGKYSLRVRAWDNVSPGVWSEMRTAVVPGLEESQPPVTDVALPPVSEGASVPPQKPHWKQKYAWIPIVVGLLLCSIVGLTVLPENGILHHLVFPSTPTAAPTATLLPTPLLIHTATSVATIIPTVIPIETAMPTTTLLPTTTPTIAPTVDTLVSPLAIPEMPQSPLATPFAPLTTTSQITP